jgi:monoterpene epsilon-lactone hydrolase
MISKKARNRKKVISVLMRLVILIKPGSLTHFQIRIIRQLVLIASYRRPSVNNTIFEKIKLDQLDLYRIKPKKLSDTKKILFFHGGGFFVGNFKIYRHYVSFLAEVLGREIIFVEYKLSPESKYPSQLEDAKKAYSFLLGKEEQPNIILAGDSAGGNLALALMLALKKDKLKKPKGIFCISPWVDPTAIMAEYPDSCCQSDVLIGPFIKRAKETGSGPLSYLYCNASVPKNPFISPLFGDFKNSPPIMIQYAENEMLSVQIETFLKQLKKQRVKVLTKVWKDLWHDFQLETDLIETRRSFALFRDFLDELPA